LKFKKSEEEDYSLQLTSLIDVVFLLLIFFMVSTAFIDFSRKLEISLPESMAGAAMEKVKVYEIEVSVDEVIYLNGEPATLESLAAQLQAPDETIIKRSAVIRADRELDYGFVVKVMGLCKEAGILDIGIAVQ
jgi:biopolymer transport protein ExbD